MSKTLRNGRPSREEEVALLEQALRQLKVDYEQYFLGQRAREPIEIRTNLERNLSEQRRRPIQNTAVRFRLDSLASRFQTYGQHWNRTQREIESGTYCRHLFKDRLHADPPTPPPPKRNLEQELFDAYRDAATSCGQSLAGLTPDRLKRAVAQQEQKLRKKFGQQAIEFHVVVAGGRVKLRARPRRN